MTIAMCPGCGQEKEIKAKGLCRNCYQQQKRRGTTARDRMPRGMCTVEGCDKPAHGRRLCGMHLKRLKVSGSLDDPRADNVNLRTNQQLYGQWQSYLRPDAYPMVSEWRDDFFAFMAAVGERPTDRHRLHRIDKNKPMGPGNYEWRLPHTQRRPDETTEEYNTRFRQGRKLETGGALWDGDLRRKYGADFGLRDLRAMAEAQKHLCAICGQPEKEQRNGIIRHLAVDHDHATGKVRALLCQSCNKGLGLFMDSEDLLLAAIAYLRKHAVKE